MKDKKIIIIIFGLFLLIPVIAVTYAYFTAAFNVNNSNIVDVNTVELANLTVTTKRMQGNTENIYPGWIGYQVVTVEGSGNGTGSGKYNLSISAPEYAMEFGNDVTYTVYRSNSNMLSPLPDADSFTGEYASGTLQMESVGNEFRYSIEGASFTVPNSYTLVSENNLLSSAKNSAITFVNSRDYTGTTKEAYIIVYKYNNNGNQDTQQNKSFTTVINATVDNMLPKNIISIDGFDLEIDNNEINSTLASSQSLVKTFTLTNTNNVAKSINIVIDNLVNSSSNISYSISENGQSATTGNLIVSNGSQKSSMLNTNLAPNTSKTYTLTLSNNGSSSATVSGIIYLSSNYDMSFSNVSYVSWGPGNVEVADDKIAVIGPVGWDVERMIMDIPSGYSSMTIEYQFIAGYDWQICLSTTKNTGSASCDYVIDESSIRGHDSTERLTNTVTLDPSYKYLYLASSSLNAKLFIYNISFN